MVLTTTAHPSIDALYKVRKGKVEFVDVPDLGFVMIDGNGAPGGALFTEALQALYSVSYGAHFALKKARGSAPRVMPLEGLWWTEGAEAHEMMPALAAGEPDTEQPGRDQWRWRLMIMQLSPIDERTIQEATRDAKAKKQLPTLDAVRYESWAEGPSAQIMHIGPYATESSSIAALRKAIADHGSHPRGHHDEIYLGDPRTSAPDKLRTILRRPIEPGT